MPGMTSVFSCRHDIARERGNRALVNVLYSRQFSRLRNAIKNSVSEAPKLVSTKTLLLKHYHRCQGLLHFDFRARRKSLKRFAVLSCDFRTQTHLTPKSLALEIVRFGVLSSKETQRTPFPTILGSRLKHD